MLRILALTPLCVPLGLLPQDGPGARPEFPIPEATTPAADALVPGELPAETSPELRALWQKVLTATRTAGENAELEPVRALRIVFDLRWRPDGRQTNDVSGAEYEYLAPGFVRARLQSGRSLVRGPEGDFLLDGEEVVRLEGRESAEDRQQLDQTLRIARSYLALSDPRALRIARIERALPPDGLPPKLAARAALLEWLQIDSPDFGLSLPSVAKGIAGAEPMFRVRLGLERASARIALVEIARDRRPGEPRVAPEVFTLNDYFERDGFFLPRNIALYELGERRDGTYGYRDAPTNDLWLHADSVSLRAPLVPDDFKPPPPR